MGDPEGNIQTLVKQLCLTLLGVCQEFAFGSGKDVRRVPGLQILLPLRCPFSNRVGVGGGFSLHSPRVALGNRLSPPSPLHRALHPLSDGHNPPSMPPGRVWVWMGSKPCCVPLVGKHAQLHYLPSSASCLMKLALCETWL